MFDADWAGNDATIAMPCTRLVVSPVNARPRILDLVTGAQTTLEIESMQFGDPRSAPPSKPACKAGSGRARSSPTPTGSPRIRTPRQYLKDLGVTVESIPHLHTKVIVVDGARAYLGSENLRRTRSTTTARSA